MENRPKLYATAAFVAGILVTLGYKDFYPELEFRFWRHRAANRTLAGAGLHDDDHIELEDHEKDDRNVIKVPEGIEASIGNTPLFKIKSLSEETGCDILAKAEVQFGRFIIGLAILIVLVVPQWGWWKPQGQSSFEHHPSGKMRIFYEFHILSKKR